MLMAAARGHIWMKGTFLILLSNTTWSLWIVLQASLPKEYPNKLLSTLVQFGLSTAQSFLLAVAVERDPAAWKLQLDVGLLAVAYSVSSSIMSNDDDEEIIKQINN